MLTRKVIEKCITDLMASCCLQFARLPFLLFWSRCGGLCVSSLRARIASLNRFIWLKKKASLILLSFCHGSGVVSSVRRCFKSMEEDLVRMATELTRQANQMHEVQLELKRLATTSQTEQRAQVAEEKACAAVTAIGMINAPEQKKTKLNNRDAEKFRPETYTADPVDKKSLVEFLGVVETYLSVLAPGLLARPLLKWAAAFRDQPIVMSDVETYEAAHGKFSDWILKEVSKKLGPLLHKVCEGSAGVKLKAVMKTYGFNAWRVLAFWFQARSTIDSMSLLTMIMNPDRAKDLSDMMNKLDRWDAPIRDYDMKFENDDISDKMRQAALFAEAPEAVAEKRLAGRRDLDNCAKVRCMIGDMIRDKREARGAIKLSGGGN